MKNLVKILALVFAFYIALPALADKSDDPKKQKKQRQNSGANVYSSERDLSKPDPFASNSGGSFTVVRYKESKVAKKLRKGEAHSRLSVPNPKGKPLKHKKPHKFLFFG